MGWELAPAGKGYRLGRAKAAPARDAADLHAKLRRAVPPALAHMMGAMVEGSPDRWVRQMRLVYEAAERAGGKEWSEMPVGRLDAESQGRLANEVCVAQLGLWYQVHGRRERPFPWVQHPERIVLRLSGRVGPGEQPFLSLHVPDETGADFHWGWVVGSNSLQNRR